ncbi:Snf7-domain-containing protein [Peziza echinospora]|nr:Snf7-domain-containing protein [Peziza echinospora]
MGNNSSKRITSHDRAILDMKLQRDKIKQYQRKIQTILDREHEIAIECLRQGKKEKARLALRRRKYQEQMLEKADKQLETLEQLTSTIEFSLLERDVLYGLKQGNAALKEIHKEMSLDAVEKLMDETAEAIAYQKEIDALLTGRLTNDEEHEVEDELAAIEAEELAARGETPLDLPNAPVNEPVAKPETAAEVRARRARERAKAQREQQQQQHAEEDDTREMIPA